MSLGENSLVAAYQGKGQLKSRPSGTGVVTAPFPWCTLILFQKLQHLGNHCANSCLKTKISAKKTQLSTGRPKWRMTCAEVMRLAERKEEEVGVMINGMTLNNLRF